MILVRGEKNKNCVANSHVAGFEQKITPEMLRSRILNMVLVSNKHILLETGLIEGFSRGIWLCRFYANASKSGQS